MTDQPPDGQVIAVIGRPLEDPAGPPFRLLTMAERFARDRDAPPCDHGQFVVDTERRLIECGRCRQVLDPFEVVLTYAKWADWYAREFRDWWARRLDGVRRWAAELRNRRFLTEVERAELDAYRWRGIPHDVRSLVEEGDALCGRIEDALRERRWARRRRSAS